MAELKLDMKTISIDTTRAKIRVIEICREALDQVAEQMGDMIKQEIERNGNGSKVMRDDAVNMVKTICKQSNYEKIIYESGISPEALAACAFDMKVRVLTVLTGNQHGGKLYSKPGQQTFKKHVRGPSQSEAKEVYPLPEGFNQPFDITQNLIDNVERRIEHIWTYAQQWIIDEISSSAFWDQFISIR